MRRNTPFIGTRRIVGRRVLAQGDGSYSYLGQQIDHAPNALRSYPWIVTWTPEYADGSSDQSDVGTLSLALGLIEMVTETADRA